MSRVADAACSSSSAFLSTLCSFAPTSASEPTPKKAVISALRFVRIASVSASARCLSRTHPRLCCFPARLACAAFAVWTRSLIARATSKIAPDDAARASSSAIAATSATKTAWSFSILAMRSARPVCFSSMGRDRQWRQDSRAPFRAKAPRRPRPASRPSTPWPMRRSISGQQWWLSRHRARGSSGRAGFPRPRPVSSSTRPHDRWRLALPPEASQRSRPLHTLCPPQQVRPSAFPGRPWHRRPPHADRVLAARIDALTSSALPRRVSQTSSCGRGMSPGTAGVIARKAPVISSWTRWRVVSDAPSS